MPNKPQKLEIPDLDKIPTTGLICFGKGFFTSKHKKDVKLVIEIPLNTEGKNLFETATTIDLV